MLMKILWNYVDRLSLSDISKQKLFLLLNIIVWAFISLLVSLLVGWMKGIDASWVEISVVIVGYVTFGIGFLGGFIFLGNYT